jgi:hypothetical protein
LAEDEIARECGERVEKMVESDGGGETIGKVLKRPLGGKYCVVAVVAVVGFDVAGVGVVGVVEVVEVVGGVVDVDVDVAAAAVDVVVVAVVAVVVAAAAAVHVVDVVLEEESLYSVRSVYWGPKNMVFVLERQEDVAAGMVEEAPCSWIQWV